MVCPSIEDIAEIEASKVNNSEFSKNSFSVTLPFLYK